MNNKDKHQQQQQSQSHKYENKNKPGRFEDESREKGHDKLKAGQSERQDDDAEDQQDDN